MPGTTVHSRRALLGALAATPLVAGLSACGLSPQAPPSQAPIETPSVLSGEITFQTWSLKNEKFTPYFEKLVTDFTTQHAGTKINWIDQPGDGYEEKVLQQAQSNTLPDVINIPPGYGMQLAEVNKLVDLKAAAPDSIASYTEGGIKAYTYAGMDGAYGYPWYLGTDLNWWNTKAFSDYGLDASKLPTNFDEFFAAAATMAEKSGGKMPLISSLPGLGDFAAAGVKLFDGTKFTFNTPEAAAVLQKYAELYKQKALPPEVLQNNYTGNAQMFQQGKVAWTTATPSFPGDLQKNAPTLVSVTKATPRFGIQPMFVQGISVSADSKAPALALAFAQYVTSNASQVEFVKLAQGFFPGTVEANNNPSSFTSAISDPLTAEAVALAATAITKAELITPNEFSDEMSTYTAQQIALAVRGDLAPAEALDRAVKHCNDNLNR